MDPFSSHHQLFTFIISFPSVCPLRSLQPTHDSISESWVRTWKRRDGTVASPASSVSAPAKHADDAVDAGDVTHAGEGKSGKKMHGNE